MNTGKTRIWTYTLADGETLTITESMGVQRISWQVGAGATCTVTGDYPLNESLPSAAIVNSENEGATLSSANFRNPLDGVSFTASGGSVDFIATVN